jgi:hypothetical protein
MTRDAPDIRPAGLRCLYISGIQPETGFESPNIQPDTGFDLPNIRPDTEKIRISGQIEEITLTIHKISKNVFLKPLLLLCKKNAMFWVREKKTFNTSDAFVYLRFY